MHQRAEYPANNFVNARFSGGEKTERKFVDYSGLCIADSRGVAWEAISFRLSPQRVATKEVCA